MRDSRSGGDREHGGKDKTRAIVSIHNVFERNTVSSHNVVGVELARGVPKKLGLSR